ncbi:MULTISPECIES: DOPA 4,5-dioxygenase family protein [Pseudanabaena]|uniref:Dopa 45-dioxygenase n=2 Tax=Pseudanabaena TaxID=1152 RepID=L8N7U0_9CYAN|nr:MULTISPECIES: DOPA 4,5-dioxygenase family protein [Pseudanabaena]ELS34293.1 Dopa 45-dioxygenase [Pseudanabaena biceps PCC 7429]MDG3493516.1 DOPA 4,5-dioxygenase family protein [Pseudanabaena catenata USMAC16]
MTETNIITSYHAHVYYHPETRDAAEQVRQELGDRFEVQLGRWHDQLVGPHTRSMYQVAFANDQFDRLVPWLLLNRQGLAVLLHPNTGNAIADHTDHALWLGEKLEVNLEPLRRVNN